MPRKVVFTQEMEDYVRSIAEGKTCTEIANLVNAKFNTNVTFKQVETMKHHKGIKSNLCTRFQRKDEMNDFNKKRFAACENVRYKKGERGKDALPIGAIKKRSKGDGGYKYFIKVKNDMYCSDTDNWMLLSHYLYQIYNNCKISNEDNVLFANKNEEDFSKENLVLITKQEMIRMNNKKYIEDNADITKIHLSMVRIESALYKAQKRREEK